MRPAAAHAFALLASLALLAAKPAAADDIAVDLELVLAVDVSGSVDPVEAEQQRGGYVQALTDPRVLRAIGATFTGRIALTYVEWAGPTTQRVVVPWRTIDGEAAARGFVAELAEAPTDRARWTSISAALDFCVPLFAGNGYAGERRVIDVSGDGENNRGRDLADARAAALAAGVVINGLPILNDRPQPMGMMSPSASDLAAYYEQNVIGGPGSFMVPAKDFASFTDAILQKLILEIASNTNAPGLLR